MKKLWVASSTGLPYDGASIDFQLDNREASLQGRYQNQTFHSRWSGYDVDRVRAWRPTEDVVELTD